MLIRNLPYYFYAFFLDFLSWLYLIIVSKEIFYKRIIEGLEHPLIHVEDFTFYFLGAIIGAILGFIVPHSSLGKRLFLSQFQLTHHEPMDYFKFPYVWLIAILLITTLICGFNVTQISLIELLSSHGFLGVRRIFMSLFNPDFSIINVALAAVIETFFIAFMATILAMPFAFCISFFASLNLMQRTIFHGIAYVIFRVMLNFTRSIEPLVWAIIFSVWVGIGPFAGMLALMLHSISALSKLYSEQIENIDQGPQDMIVSTGANTFQMIWFGVLPQIIIPFLSFTIYRWDINLRMATIIGFVGGGGIGQILIQYQGLAQWHRVGTIILVVGLVVSLMDYVSMVARQKLKRG